MDQEGPPGLLQLPCPFKGQEANSPEGAQQAPLQRPDRGAKNWWPGPPTLDTASQEATETHLSHQMPSGRNRNKHETRLSSLPISKCW